MLAAVPDQLCQICFGTGMEVVPGRGARRCSCRSVGDKEKRIEAAQIPPLYADCTLKTFKPVKGNGSHLKAFNYAYNLVRDYPDVKKGILFQGPVGVGKTHLACGMMHGLLEKGVRGLFYEFSRILKEIQNSYNPISQASEMDVIYNFI
jgi:DNA replication protein DnaC